MKPIIAIFVGAGLGALLRWWFGLTLNSYFPSIPPGTLAANLIGGYIIGVAIACDGIACGGVRGVIPAKQNFEL